LKRETEKMSSKRTMRNGRLDYPTQLIDDDLLEDLRALVRLAIREDLEASVDLTTSALVPRGNSGAAAIIARPAGVAAGLDLIPAIIEELDARIGCEFKIHDGQSFNARDTLVILKGDTRDLLTCERTILNFVCRLCGIATLTRQFCDRIQSPQAAVYDTRKTTPGWRRLEKYATHCGGARNHRMGLFDAVLIKDNHLACRANATGQVLNPAEAVAEARKFLEAAGRDAIESTIIEVEVDSIAQCELALAARPDIILVDNMNCEQLQKCAAMRDRIAPQVELEASGGVRLDTIGTISQTGVERISVGALTHSAVQLDLGLDWIL
jgi:nicotinate-nucleotide pyrophosphorylase (carboxylating)